MVKQTKRKPALTKEEKRAAKIAKLPFADQRMLAVVDHIKANRLNGIKYDSDFLKAIDGPPNLIHSVVSNIRSFTREQLITVVKLFGVDARYLLDESWTSMFHTDRKISAEQQLIEATGRVVAEITALRKAAK